jgi:hypothetical protein
MPAIFGISLYHVLAWLILAVALIFVIRRSGAVCPRTATIILAGAVIRLALGLALHLISTYQLPVVQSLQAEPGFWQVAPDAKTYFESAVLVADKGVGAIPWDRGSPSYIVLLSAWMHLVGFTPAAGFLLNLVAYVGLCAVVVWRLRTDRLTLAPVAILTFSPVLLIHGSQPLKDELFVALIGIALAAMSLLLPRLSEVLDRRSRAGFCIAGGVLVTAVMLMSGMRAYYVFEMCAILATVFLIGFWFQPGPSRLRYALRAAVLWIAVYIGFQAGGGRYFYPELQPHTLTVQAFTALPAKVLSALPKKRMDFAKTGGGTSMVQRPPSVQESDGSQVAPTVRSTTGTSTVMRVASGLAALFVPMTLLQRLGLFDLGGGRGLVGIADLDTIYVDFTIVLTLGLVWRYSRMLRENWALTSAVVLLVVLTTLLMAYVVTNFGTLFRLRTLLTTPLWLLPLAAGGRRSESIRTAFANARNVSYESLNKPSTVLAPGAEYIR